VDWNAAIIQEFHAKHGKGVGQFGNRLALLTTTGARSGKERTAPVMYHRDGERYVIVASKAGAPDNPGWYYNLKANPVARVEVGAESGTETFEVRAHEADGEERARIWADRVAIAPGFGDYQRRTKRRIPVMILERTGNPAVVPE
jgi:deazaflavin-dependent oxidoreductase (nitroreductase family)